MYLISGSGFWTAGLRFSGPCCRNSAVVDTVGTRVDANMWGALQVRTHIPVVFFTAKGVPGEVDEGLDSVKGAMAACARAMKNAAAAAGVFPVVGRRDFRW